MRFSRPNSVSKGTYCPYAILGAISAKEAIKSDRGEAKKLALIHLGVLTLGGAISLAVFVRGVKKSENCALNLVQIGVWTQVFF